MGVAPTISDSVPDCSPEATFSTDTLKLPELLRVTGPTTCVEVLIVSALLGIVHGLQPVPVIRISAVAGSKLLPLTIKLNCWPAAGGLGFGLRLLTVGMLDGTPVTVKEIEFEVAPDMFGLPAVIGIIPGTLRRVQRNCYLIWANITCGEGCSIKIDDRPWNKIQSHHGEGQSGTSCRCDIRSNRTQGGPRKKSPVGLLNDLGELEEIRECEIGEVSYAETSLHRRFRTLQASRDRPPRIAQRVDVELKEKIGRNRG